MMDILMFVGFAVLTFAFAIGLWALGRWLRGKGYGPQLDKLNRQYTALQLQLRPFALSASHSMFSAAQSLNRLPLLGNKNSAAMNQQILLAVRAAQETQRRENTRG